MKTWRLRAFALGLATLATLAAAVPASAWEKEPLSVYQQRRAALVAQAGDGVVVLMGYEGEDVAASVTTFRQNENFYYLTGWNQPGAMLLLVPKTRRREDKDGPVEMAKEILFIPPHNYRAERWNGPVLGPNDADATAQTGFATVESTTRFHSELLKALKDFPKLYTELTPQLESGEDCFQQQEVATLRKIAPLAKLEDVRPDLTALREVKSPTEIALIRKAVAASEAGQIAAMRAVKPGVWEYQIAALMKYEFEKRGCEWPSYPPIVGSGFYSTVLHYDEDSHQMADGDVVVMDVAGSYSGYASDITRTLPVNGHFTPRQREVYDIVLGAQQAAIAAAKPGMMIVGRSKDSLYKIAFDYINSHGKDLHGKRLGQYFIHGLSHSVGLNVHDPMNYTDPLRPGMVVTVEPGIYIPDEKIGVRIEDMILITQDGAEVLTRALPKDPDQIEKIMVAR
ncbi:MAG TPA: Xaa-Pro peptidase family protein [Terriglobia bacterium]|nr:Xaa-Pro peptidase family protein [Terriglobia bacterium]